MSSVWEKQMSPLCLVALSVTFLLPYMHFYAVAASCLKTHAGSWGYEERRRERKREGKKEQYRYNLTNMKMILLFVYTAWRSTRMTYLTLDRIPRLMHQFWTVEPEKPAQRHITEWHLKWEVLIQDKTFLHCTGSHQLLLLPSTLLPPVSETQYLCTAERPGRYVLRPPAHRCFIPVPVTGWSDPSLCHLPDLQQGISLDGHGTVLSGPTWVAQGDPISAAPAALAISCSSLPRPHFYALWLSTQNQPARLISPLLSCWAPALTGLSFSDLVQ